MPSLFSFAESFSASDLSAGSRPALKSLVSDLLLSSYLSCPSLQIPVLSDPVWSVSVMGSISPISPASLGGFSISAIFYVAGALPVRSGVSCWNYYALLIFNPPPPSAPLPESGVEFCKHCFDLACTLGNICVSICILIPGGRVHNPDCL